jgi:hypothetical protein
MGNFDIQRFLKLSGPVQHDDLDWDRAKAIGVTGAEARILRYMADTETHTILYMRDLLAGHSARDPRITAFLSVWVYEELWHGRALDRFLTEVGHPPPPEHYGKVTGGAHIREMVEAVASHLAASLTPRFIAVHMTWGAINELTAGAAYQTVERRTKNPELAKLLNRITRQERKHFSFYYQEAEQRLEGEPRTQALVNFALRRLWTVVGSGVGGDDNLAFIAAAMFADAEGLALLREQEEVIRKLPGLGWFDLLTKQVAAAAERHVSAHGVVDYGAPRVLAAPA